MPQQVQQRVVLHLGFHKTATTKIQAVLQENSKKIERAGSYVIPHQKVRNKFMKCVEVKANRGIGMTFAPKLKLPELEHHAKRMFQAGQISNFERIILSEENAFGHVGQCVFPGTLYRFPKNYVWTFNDLLPVPVEEIHVAVRSYDRFFASCYTEYLGSLKAARYITGAEMVAKIMAAPPNWCDLIQILRDIFPKTRINVWVFEEFRRLMPQLLAQLAGCEITDKDINSGERLRRSPGAEAVAEFEQIRARAGTTAALANWKKNNQDDTPQTTKPTPYAPWRDKDRDHLHRLYHQDLETISAMENVVLHQ